MAELIDTIESLATKPASVTSDGLSVSEHPIGDLVAFDRYKDAKAAAGRKARGLRFTQLVPGAAVAGDGRRAT